MTFIVQIKKSRTRSCKLQSQDSIPIPLLKIQSSGVCVCLPANLASLAANISHLLLSCVHFSK